MKPSGVGRIAAGWLGGLKAAWPGAVARRAANAASQRNRVTIAIKNAALLPRGQSRKITNNPPAEWRDCALPLRNVQRNDLRGTQMRLC